jgi:SAM-dependent methyltransferase
MCGASVDSLKNLSVGNRVSERDFDLIFPPLVRKLSRAHWTPLAAAQRAVQLLVKSPGDKVLDIGSGAGKLCIVGALTTKGVFTGVEKDAELVRVAKQIVRQHKIERVRYVHGDAMAQDWGTFQALYLFNPFANATQIKKDSLTNVPVPEEIFVELVKKTTMKMAGLPVGMRIVTYHGFGAEMPPNVIQEAAEIVGPGVLQLWRTV